MSVSDLSDMNLTPEELEQSDKGGGFNLKVPAKAELGRKKGIAQWTEYVVVEDAYRESAPGKEGQKRTLFTLSLSVKAGGDEPENVDRKFSVFMRLNPGFMKGKIEDLGQGVARSETSMHTMSMKKVKQIMVAIGLPLTQGLTAEVVNAMFPTADESANSVLIGRTFAVLMKDNAINQYNGANRQEADAILAAPEGV